MKNLASNPIVIIAVSLVLGVGSGLGWFMKAAKPLIEAARQARAQQAEAAKPDAPWDFWTLEIENLANELKDEKAVLKKREEELATREARFAAERQELLKQRQQIESLRSEIGNRMIEIQADEAKNIKTLTATYSQLAPKSVLTIFKEMDDVMVVKLMASMKTDTVSALFEEMAKQAATDPSVARRAAQLSEKLRLFKSTKTAAAP